MLGMGDGRFAQGREPSRDAAGHSLPSNRSMQYLELQEDSMTTTDTAPVPVTPPDDAQPVPPSAGPEDTTPADAPETFDRAYVEQLRRENAAARVKAKRADGLGTRLVTAYAASTGRLADATDLPYDEALLDEDGLPDAGKVAAAVETLLERKPHLAVGRVLGDVGQGARLEAPAVSLAGLLRAGAG